MSQFLLLINGPEIKSIKIKARSFSRYCLDHASISQSSREGENINFQYQINVMTAATHFVSTLKCHRNVKGKHSILKVLSISSC